MRGSPESVEEGIVAHWEEGEKSLEGYEEDHRAEDESEEDKAEREGEKEKEGLINKDGEHEEGKKARQKCVGRPTGKAFCASGDASADKVR